MSGLGDDLVSFSLQRELTCREQDRRGRQLQINSPQSPPALPYTQENDIYVNRSLPSIQSPASTVSQSSDLSY